MTQHLRPNPNALAETTAARALISAAIILNALHLLGISYRAREVFMAFIIRDLLRRSL